MGLGFKSRRRWLFALFAVALASVALTACGSSSHPSTKRAAGFTVPPIDAPCQQVAAVLSDGPDPGADPVGYAQAQVLQLRLLKLSHSKLADAVDRLAWAYERFSASDGRAGTRAVNAAQNAVNVICPGAAN